jgi:hypothetical protein
VIVPHDLRRKPPPALPEVAWSGDLYRELGAELARVAGGGRPR